MDTSVAVESPRRRRRSSSSSTSASSSPEFEFWIAPQPQLLTADELFCDGLLLPLRLLPLHHPVHGPTAACNTEPAVPSKSPPQPPAEASITAPASCSPASPSKRWKDLFKVGEKKKEQRMDRRSGAAELNISIWPFSRSRSSGSVTAFGGRPRAAAYGRKASSAPCSRSNSRGESEAVAAAGRRLAASPGSAGGVHIGRSSPVWQIRRGSKVVEPVARRRPDKNGKVTAGKKDNRGGIGVKVLHLSVNTCIGDGCHVTCRGDGREGVTGGYRSPLNLRTLLSKKVY